MAPARKRPKRVVPFLDAHEYLYGVRAVERDRESNEATCVLCMFCAAFGREDDPRAGERRRARTQKPKFWGGPCFRSDNYKSHLAMQHPTRWQQYQLMSLEQKQSYFGAVEVPLRKEEHKVQGTDVVEAVGERREQKQEQDQEHEQEQEQEQEQEGRVFDAESAESLDDVEAAAAVQETDAETVEAVAHSPVVGIPAVQSPVVEVEGVAPPVAIVAAPAATAEVEMEEEGGGEVWTFLLDRDVVDVALREVLCGVEGVVNGLAGMKPLFESTLDQRDEQDQQRSDGTAEYRTVVRSVQYFRRVVELLALGLNFDQTAALCRCEEGNQITSELHCSADVTRVARVAVGANLQALSTILQRSWAFSLDLLSVDRRQSGESEPRLYLDVRLRVCSSARIELFHLLALPVTTEGNPNAIGDRLFDTIARFLQALHRRWLYKVIGCSTEVIGPSSADTSSVMTVVSATLALKVNQLGLAELIRVSDARSALDMMVQRFIDSIIYADGAAWQKHFSSLSAYLQRQISTKNAEELVAAGIGPCPRVSNLPWWRLVKTIRWFDDVRVPIHRLLARKNTSIAPPPQWWLHLKMVLVIGSMALKTRAGLQGGYTSLLLQQPQRISMLRLALAGDVGVDGPLPEYQRASLRNQSVSGTMIGSNDGMFAVKPHSIVAFVRGMDNWVATLFDALSAVERQKIILNTADSVLDLVHGLHGLGEELEGHRGSSITSLRSFPPVLPQQVAALHPVEFQHILHLHRARLVECLTNAELAAIEMQHDELRTAATSEAGVRHLLDFSAEGSANSFDQAWGVLRHRWKLLADFCGGLASVFPLSKGYCGRSAAATPPIQSAATKMQAYYILEAQLQCQQFTRLKDATAV